MANHSYRDDGIVLRTYKLGEADRIVVLMTRANGKVRAVAKGVRRTKSKFGARLEPTSHVALQLHIGRELDIVTQAETADRFGSIRVDLERFARASAMLEAVDQLASEREENPRLFDMLLGALRTLDQRDTPLVSAGFFLKVLALEGFRPEVGRCVECGSTTEPLVSFDDESGGLRCRPCRRGVAISPGAVVLLQDILGGRLSAALAEPPGPATHEIDHLSTRLMEHHLERRLRSVGVLERS